MFNKRVKIRELLAQEPTGQEVTVMGWVRSFRNNQFIALNDGSCISNLQVVMDAAGNEALLKKIANGAAISATGTVIASLGKGQRVELKADTVEVLGECDNDAY